MAAPTAARSIVFAAADEGQFDRPLQETKERFLFFLFAANGFAGMAAKWTQPEEFSTAPTQAMHTLVTHDLTAMCALVSDPKMPVSGTHQSSVGQHHRRGRARHLEPGYGNCDGGTFNEKIDIAQP